MVGGLALMVLVVVPGVLRGQDKTPFVQTQDLVYGETHGAGLLMDHFAPTGEANGLAIVDVASGAWYSDRGKIRDHLMARFYHTFCSRGYHVFAIRPGSRTKFTVMEMDNHVKQGIRHVKKNAGTYHIDPARLGLTGASAGGHLASLAALTPETKDGLDTQVAAVAVFFPPTDFVDWGNGKPVDMKLLASLVGEQATPEATIEAAKRASPFFQVKGKTSPFLLIHGDADEVVPLMHSEKLVKALKEQGSEVELMVKAGGGHPWLTIPEEVAKMADWFDQKLKP